MTFLDIDSEFCTGTAKGEKDGRGSGGNGRMRKQEDGGIGGGWGAHITEMRPGARCVK